MIWAAMGVFGAVTSAVNHAWGVEKQPSYFKHKLISFVMLVVASLLLLLGLLLVSAINVVEARWFAVVVDAGAAAGRAAGLRRCAGRRPSVFIFVVGLVFYFVPERQGAVPRRVGRRGGDRLAWRGALAGFSWYVQRSDAVQQRPRIDRRGRRVPGLDLHLGGHPAVRRGSDGRERPPAPPPARRNPGGADARADRKARPHLSRLLRTTGPLITAPSLSKREPWHGQSQVVAAGFQATMQPRCGQTADRRWISPRSSRYTAIFAARLHHDGAVARRDLVERRDVAARQPVRVLQRDVEVLLHPFHRGAGPHARRVVELLPRVRPP